MPAFGVPVEHCARGDIRLAPVWGGIVRYESPGNFRFLNIRISRDEYFPKQLWETGPQGT